MQKPGRRALISFGMLILGFLAAQGNIFALPYNHGTYGTCTFSSCGISVSSSSTVAFGITPNAGTIYSTTSDTITVTTEASTGYTLTLADGDTNTALVSGSNTFAASSGTQASPILRAANTWGYRIDGVGGFGAGPTSAEANVSSSSFTFAGVPASTSTADTLKTTSSAASSGDTTTVWYGVASNSSQPSGTYTDIVVYTATTN